MPGVLMKVLAAVSVMRPETDTAVPDELFNTPPDASPVPATVSPFNKLLPLRSIAAPLATVASPVPKALLVIAPTAPTEATPTFSVPPKTLAPPEYVLAPDKVRTPAPDLLKLAPELVSAVAHVMFWPLVSTL